MVLSLGNWRILALKIAKETYFTANIFESGPMPTPWNFLDRHTASNL